MIPHSHFGMSGPIQRHTLVYTVVIASTLAVFFDLGRIASLGAFFYLVMDMVVHWGISLSAEGDRGSGAGAPDGARLRCRDAGGVHVYEAGERSRRRGLRRLRHRGGLRLRTDIPVALDRASDRPPALRPAVAAPA